MKKLLSASLLIFLAITVSAQKPSFSKNDKVINATLGFGSVLYSGSYYSTAIPPIAGSLELGVKDNFLVDNLSLGIGGYLGYSQYKWDYYGWGWSYSNIIIGGRASLHFPLIDNFDTYGGMMLGFNLVSSNEYGLNNKKGVIIHEQTKSSRLLYSFYAGGRYYFTKNIAALGEIGYGISWINVGLSFKL